MKKVAKKTKVKAVAPPVHDPLAEVEALIAGQVNVDKWLLVPIPEPKFAGPANRAKFIAAIVFARVPLVYDKFGRLYDHARELSDAGGILRVETVHIRSWTKVDKSRVFIDGKMEDKE